ncbi:MAG TPA: dienelactone hydrolase family protein [Vicinamibacterales bacterium]|nr:dienelactone hydrolase family protein [Vicinamibacterales bacterium]
MVSDPHAGQPVLASGPAPAGARLTVILVHGRGGTAAGMIDLSRTLGIDDVAYRAPQAAGNTWYPLSFLAPMAQNEPGLSSGLSVLGNLVTTLERDGVASSRIALLGFSQGACLTLEFVARHARRYAAVVGLSGGVIGPPGTPRNYSGSLAGTPVLLACSDVDAHIPLERVHESTTVFRALGGVVDERIYPGMGHTVTDEEIELVRKLLR